MQDAHEVVQPAIRSRCAKHSGAHAMGADCWLCKKLKHASDFLEGQADDPHDDATESAIGLLAADTVLRVVKRYVEDQLILVREAVNRETSEVALQELGGREWAFKDMQSAIHVAMSEQCQLMGG